MLEEARKFLRQGAGKAIATIASLLLIAMAGYVIFHQIQSPMSEANYRVYVDTETGQSFKHKNVIGETIPVSSPFTNRNTGMPGEPCFWTADGKIKKDPTWVLLNEEVGKSGPTFCPDCGRLVVGHNPPATPGIKPPPTKEEYELLHNVHR